MVVVDGQAQTLMPVVPPGFDMVSDVVFTAGSISITADLIEASTTASTENEVEANINGELEAESVTTARTGVEEVETGNTASGGSASIQYLKDQEQ